jgi:tetratricopeptide (TPR) repeat protein
VEVPADLVDKIRQGRAALVVGASFGVLAGQVGWRELLSRLAGELDDKPARTDVEARLAEGRLASAAGYLWRTLGDRAGELAADTFRTPERLGAAARLLGRIPVRAVWTTHPGTLVEKAITTGSPEGWPAPRVLGPTDSDEIDLKRRQVVKLLGSGAAYSILKPSPAARAIAELHGQGALLLVGFGVDDPDLRAILGLLPAPGGGATWLAAPEIGPVAAASLRADHGIQTLPLGEGRAADGLSQFLGALAVAGEARGISLARVQPKPDDLEGWLELLVEDPTPDVREAIAALESRARQSGQADRLVDILVARLDVEPAGRARAELLGDLSRVFEDDVGDLPRAFTALSAALREDPSDPDILVEAERLAVETDGWGQLIADLSEIVPQVAEPPLAAAHWTRIGGWYRDRMGHEDYALGAYREALKLDPTHAAAHEALAEILRGRQRWADLGAALAARAAVASGEEKAKKLLELGQLEEAKLARPLEAIAAYEGAVAGGVAPFAGDALAALDRLYRQRENWGRLAAVLDRRAAALSPAEQAPLREELARLRSEKLRDVEGEVARWEAELGKDPVNTAALSALEPLYERLGRPGDALGVLERRAALGGAERGQLWRKVAAEKEARGDRPGARAAYEQVFAAEPAAVDAARSLERLYRADDDPEALVRLFEKQIAELPPGEGRVEPWLALARTLEHDLDDPHRALEACRSARELALDAEAPLVALVRLATRVGAWEEAVAARERLAETRSGAAAAALWVEAGAILAGELGDLDGAERSYQRALAVDPRHLGAQTALARLARTRGQLARAAELLVSAERLAPVDARAEKARLLAEAAQLHEERLGDAERAREIWGRVLALDPDHAVAGARVVEGWLEAGRHGEAAAVLEMLLRREEGTSPRRRALRLVQLARAAAALGERERAERRYREALTEDGEGVEALVGLGHLAWESGDGAAAEKAYREALGGHLPALAHAERVELWQRLATLAGKRGDTAAAAAAWQEVLALEPGRVDATRELTALAEANGDWATVVRGKRRLLDQPGVDRARLLEEIGDLSAERLGDAAGALGAYREALRLRPGAALLGKLLALQLAEKDWRRALETLERLAAAEKDPGARARYAFQAAEIARDHLELPSEAVRLFTAALDDPPSVPKAFEAIEQLLGDRGDWAGLVRAYRGMLGRLGDRATDAQLVYLWTNLGDVAADKLGHGATAIAAYETVARLDATHVGRRAELVELLLAGGGDPRRALPHLEWLLRKFPDRRELYQRLAEVYAGSDEAGEIERALAVLDGKPVEARTAVPRRRLTEELWQKALVHPRADRAISSIFAALSPWLARLGAQPPGALGLGEVVEGGRVRELAARLGVGAPDVYRGAAMKVLNVTRPDGSLAVALVLPDTPLDVARVAKKLATLRPDRFVIHTQANLEAALEGALAAAGVSLPRKGTEGERLARLLQGMVPEAVLGRVAALAKRVATPGAAAWLTGVDLGANRAALAVTGDVGAVARVVTVEEDAPPPLSARDRVKDLLAFAVSEEYLSVVRHMRFVERKGEA